MTNTKALKELQVIPGVGKSIAQDLVDIGIRSVKDLKGKDPERLYERSCEKTGTLIDRCLLYVYRCAVYYASHEKHDPKLLRWWNWKDKKGSGK
jgi:hypothetical protein